MKPSLSPRRARAVGCCGIFLPTLWFAAAGISNATAADRPANADRAAATDTPDPAGNLDQAATHDPRYLSTPDYQARQQATLDLWRNRETSRDQVQRATRDPDPEIAGRARWVLDQWRRGILPDMPPEMARRLQSADEASAMDQLLTEGYFAAATIALEESAGTPAWELLKLRANSTLQAMFPFHVTRASADGKVDDLLRLIDAVTDDVPMAVCRVEMMRRLGIDVTQDNWLPAGADSWPPAVRLRSQVHVAATLGRIDQALALVEGSPDPASAADDPVWLDHDGVPIEPSRLRSQLKQSLLIVSQRWDDALRASQSDVDPTQPPGPDEAIQRSARHAVLADRAGDVAARDAALDDLVRFGQSIGDASPAAQQACWATLVAHGRVPQGIDVLTSISPETASLLALTVNDFDRAMKLIGFPLQTLDTDLDQRIRDAIQSQSQAADGLQPPLADLLNLMIGALSIGRNDIAWQIATKISQADLVINTITGREYVVYKLRAAGKPDWMLRLMISPGQRELGRIGLSNLAFALDDVDEGTAAAMIATMKKMRPDSSLRDRIDWTASWLSGNVPRGFDPIADTDRLYKELDSYRAESDDPFSQSDAAQISVISLRLAEMFLRLGRKDLSSQAHTHLMRKGDLDALFSLAESERGSGRSDRAEAIVAMIERAIAARTLNTNPYRINGAGTDLAIKIPIFRWLLARRAGDADLIDKYQQQIRLILCSPSAEHRQLAIDYLVENEVVDLAREGYESLLLFTGLSQDDATYFFEITYAYAAFTSDTDPAAAARWLDQGVLFKIRSAGQPPLAFVFYPVLVQGYRLQAAIADRDAQAAQAAIDRIQAIDPLDIDHAERLLPLARQAGMSELADQAITEITRRGQELLRVTPYDAMTLNNLAWVLAVNGQNLDIAQQWSSRAVRLEPESSTYRDTLAEILFRRGDVDQALAIERACTIDSPGERHLYEQIGRFEAALP